MASEPTEKHVLEADDSWKLASHRTSSRSLRHHADSKRKALLGELYAHPGIHNDRSHGMMIDAGSTGSRLHIYEWKPRVLRSNSDVEDAASGNKLSYPDTHTRWTDRLQPGLSTFASITDDDELVEKVANYFEPLLDFAKTVLHANENHWGTFPIYLRATAGMRNLEREQRARVMKAVRVVFSDSAVTPFKFESDEQARVISGEEEAVFDWTAVNFLMGNLVTQTEGTGTVRPSFDTHGALDLGGASTQISFYEPNEDIMSNLFKLQIGQSKHWNIYAHSFLSYGMNEAIHRFVARLASQNASNNTAVRNPCWPVGVQRDTQTVISVTDGMESWADHESNVTLFNDQLDAELCFGQVKELLHLSSNEWCNFAHRGDCSLAGVYQPQLPSATEYIAFSNFYHVWQMLQLPERSTVTELGIAARAYCANPPVDEDPTNCFRAAYAYQVLHSGYGFGPDHGIRAVSVVGGQHVGWALGAMLYEINTLPWRYEDQHNVHFLWLLLGVVMVMFFALWAVLANRERRLERWYQPIKDVDKQQM